jgi:hypothetical protein
MGRCGVGKRSLYCVICRFDRVFPSVQLIFLRVGHFGYNGSEYSGANFVREKKLGGTEEMNGSFHVSSPMKRRHAKTLFQKCGSYGCDCGGDYDNGSGSEFVSVSVSESVSGPSMLLSVACALRRLWLRWLRHWLKHGCKCG